MNGMLNIKLGVIGAGNMGGALIEGMVSSGTVSPQAVFVADSKESRVASLAEKLGIKASSPLEIAALCDIIIIAVKPDAAERLLRMIAPYLGKDGVIVSIVAGLSVADMLSFTGGGRKVVRVMPNTPALVRQAMSAVCGGGAADRKDIDTVLSLFSCVGRAVEVGEDKMDAVVGVSGSSPAFIFQVIEAMGDAGVMAGLKREEAYLMAAQAVLGAAKMVIETGMHPGALKDMVTSPAGTTIEGVYKLEKGGVRASFIEAVSAVAAKSKELSKK